MANAPQQPGYPGNYRPSPYPPYPQKKSIGLGLASIGIAVFVFTANFVCAIYLMGTVPPGTNPNASAEAALGSLALAVAVPILSLSGVVVGVTGIAIRKENTVLSIIGICLNLFPVFCACGFVAMVWQRG